MLVWLFVVVCCVSFAGCRCCCCSLCVVCRVLLVVIDGDFNAAAVLADVVVR